LDEVLNVKDLNLLRWIGANSFRTSQGNKKGVFTRERKPKMAAHYLRERWLAIPDFGYKP
jgi:hypothetical protein